MGELIEYDARLRMIRAKLKLTQEELAPRLNISRRVVNEIEGGREPSPKFLENFCRAFGFPLNDPDFFNKLPQITLPESEAA